MFIWTKSFETNIERVDSQHKHLVELINNLSEKINNDSLSFEDMNTFFGELLEYTKYHFSSEEELMKEKNINKEFFKDHCKNHEFFVETVINEYSTIDENNMGVKAKALLDFLINWLAFHILRQDKMMGIQLNEIDKGVPPNVAYKKIKDINDQQTEPLVHSLSTLFTILSDRNKELLKLKNNLEKMVDEKTQELVAKNKELEYISMTDQLTKLPNRRFALQVLQIHWANGGEISIVMLDADNFKDVNDEFGHDMGDKVLFELSKTIKNSIRTDDICARLGGDEFLIICLDTDKKGTQTVASNILSNINEMKVLVGKRSNKNVYWKSSASLGVATKTADMENFYELIKEADKRLYEAKNAGRNCIK